MRYFILERGKILFEVGSVAAAKLFCSQNPSCKWEAL